MNQLLDIVWYRSIGRLYHFVQKYVKYRVYEHRLPGIERTIAEKEKKRVVFFVVSIGMWKSNSLFQMLLDDSNFEPYIVSYLYPKDSLEYRKALQDEMKTYFKSLNFPFIECYDFSTNEWFDIKAFKPDIVFYAQPYNHGYKRLLLEELWDRCLFGYIPYCLNLECNPVFYTFLYQNICWKSYCATLFNKEFEGKLLFNKGKRMVVVGHPLFDELDYRKKCAVDNWKIKDRSIKRIIWAPHHSIADSKILSYSNFLQIAHDMIRLLDLYKDSIQIAFKPHPRLKTKLYNHPDWGQAKTDEYYSFWANNNHSILADGEYVDLFLTSDAMVHDCSSFTCEYLYTEKPVMFLSKNNHSDFLNELGKECYCRHYHGRTINDVEKFIQDVINGIDPKSEERKKFKRDYLCGISDRTAGQLVYEDIKKSLSL